MGRVDLVVGRRSLQGSSSAIGFLSCSATWRSWAGPCSGKTKPSPELVAALAHNSSINHRSRRSADWKRLRHSYRLEPLPKWSKKRFITSMNIKSGWIIGLPGGGANPSVAGPSNQPAARLSAGSSDQGNIGAAKETKLCCVWKHSGAMVAGTCSFHTIAKLTYLKTEMRPNRSGCPRIHSRPRRLR